MIKNFLPWIQLKQVSHERDHKPPYFKEGELWWCNIGENIGTEMNGKGKLFARPVLVFKKLSRYNFIGIPLTTQNKIGSWYTVVTFAGKKSTVNLSQVRVFDYKRFVNKLGELDTVDFNKIRNSMRELLSL